MVGIVTGHADLGGSEWDMCGMGDDKRFSCLTLVTSDDHFRRPRGKGARASHRSLHVGLCVSAGCHNEISQTGGPKQRAFIFSVWRLKFKTKLVAVSVSGAYSLPGLQMAASFPHPCTVFPQCTGAERVSSVVSYLGRVLILLDQGPHFYDLISP